MFFHDPAAFSIDLNGMPYQNRWKESESESKQMTLNEMIQPYPFRAPT